MRADQCHFSRSRSPSLGSWWLTVQRLRAPYAGGTTVRMTLAFATALMLVGIAASAHGAGSVLIYGPSSPGSPSLEQQAAQDLGLAVTVADATTWSAMTTTAQFATYNAIVFGDPGCGLPPAFILAAAEANRTLWSPAITGPIVLIGTDPKTTHFGDPEDTAGRLLTKNGISFAASGSGTGLYVSLSCYYFTAAPGTPVTFLDQIGAFTVEGQFLPGFTGVNCNAPGTIVNPTHPVMAGLNDANFSLSALSPHECFDSFPASFGVLVKETSGNRPFIVATTPPDTTPPEAVLQFDPAIQDVRVFGQDAGSGVGSVICVPGATGRICTVTDNAGNKLVLTVKVEKGSEQLEAVVTSLQYCTASCSHAITPVRNEMKFSWSLVNGKLKTLRQRMEAGSTEVRAEFDAAKGQTEIEVTEPTEQRFLEPGLVLLHMATDQGHLAIEFH